MINKQYKTKTVKIHAIQWDGSNLHEVAEWAIQYHKAKSVNMNIHGTKLMIVGLVNFTSLDVNDYAVVDDKNFIMILTPKDFDKSYVEVR